jgi:hypothetical protein
MKKTTIIMTALLLVLAASVQADLVGRWTFDGNAFDSSGNLNDGILAGGAAYAGGKFDQALSLDGIDDHVSVSDSTSLDITSAITVGGWIKLASLVGPPNVAGKWRDLPLGVHLRGYLLTAYNGEPRFYISTNGINYPSARGTSITLSPDTWYHLAGTYDGANIKLYVDSTLVKTVGQTGDIFSNNEPLLIGANDGYGGVRKFTDGLIDEVRIYDHALTAVEVAELLVVDPVDVVEDLVLMVMIVNEENEIPNSSLETKLNAALNTLDDVNENNDVAAINTLGNFIDSVIRQRNRGDIPPLDAQDLIDAAQSTIDLLTNG